MNWQWILWAGLVIFGACSLSRQRNSETKYAIQLDSHEFLTQQITRWDTSVDHVWQTAHHLRELSVFKPMGMVSYHPDSGLHGQMAEVRMYRSRTEITDSSYHRHGRVTQQQDMHERKTALKESASRSEERLADQRTTLFPWWVGVVAFICGSIVLLRLITIR